MAISVADAMDQRQAVLVDALLLEVQCRRIRRVDNLPKSNV